ncbi:type II toxin-antitoxin system PemK/MazF family toxin [Candidatus Woesearchaeota archaeon]|nr:type II toxin-antitoxin system PemK/MazF family toxin [Candidatus Woesearchaeota archaeon]MBW2993889.1 type II toxin-antitoxin system PemK/MazF family toxin [Candidatus Woesearchaeota archaeon]
MEKLMKGDVIVIPFPFSDLTSNKKRPALIAAALKGDDFVLCQITSKSKKDNYAISLSNKDFEQGNLSIPSMIRPNKLFTANKSLIEYKIGSLKKKEINNVSEKICEIFKK